MKYGVKEIKDLSNTELTDAWLACLDAEAKREAASKHPKFKTMQFQPINPAFIKLKNELKTEIDKRKLNEQNAFIPKS